MPTSIYIGYINSSKKQKCKQCHAEIPARERSLRITKRTTGEIKMVSTYYVCMKCDNTNSGLEENKK